MRGPWLRFAGGAAAVCCCGVFAAAAVKAKSRPAPKKVVELSPWEQAEHGWEMLEAIPDERRTPAEYVRAMNGFRAIYHASPRDLHAAESVNAVAELLAEQGRTMHDAKSSKAALGQFEFLRTQYPGSSLRVPALLAEGQIDENDLHDKKAARERYALLLLKYPHSEHADEAQAAIAAMDQPRRSRLVSDRAKGMASSDQGMANAVDRDAAVGPALEVKAAGARPGQMATVSGIRHWSTSTYTRVAIDLGDDVTYEAARVPNPERIYFDLHGTRLAQELAGKSFNVTDEGFLKRIRIAQFSNDMTRVVLDVNNVTEYSAFLLPNPYRLIIDIHGAKILTTPTMIGPMPQPQRRSKTAGAVPNTVAMTQSSSADVAALSQQPGKVEATSKPTSQPISAVVPEDDSMMGDVEVPPAPAPAPTSLRVTAKTSTKSTRRTKATEDAAPAPAALPTADGQTSLVRALGLKIGRIVIDPGHGGHDSGTLGADGIEEKDVVLDVALRLGKLLHERLGSEIIYTRSDDTFIPLETRTAIANKAQADLFISVHANSSSDETARGVETYYLNFTSDPDALDVASRENAVSTQSIYQLSDLVKKIALKEKIDESREFASDVEQSLYSGLQSGNAGLKNRGVKKAPFVVLIGANMPSILAEISFVTNPKDASQLRRPDYRERVAESLYKGVAKYAGGLSGVKAPIERASRQSSRDSGQ